MSSVPPSPGPEGPESLPETLRVEGAQVLASLVRAVGDLDLAQDALQDAIVTALERWTTDDRPDNLAAWLTTTARHRAIDRIRRERRRLDREAEATLLAELARDEGTDRQDLLGLMFTCCHPTLGADAQVALCLRTVCQLTTAEIASAFLVSEPTMTRRITRAKHRIRQARIPYRVPTDAELPDRLQAVLAAVYLVFTTGHHAPTGETGSRIELTDEAIRLSRLLVELMPDEAEAQGLLALCLATAARRPGRYDRHGDTVTLPDQDRTRWDHALVAEASALLQRTLALGEPGPYQLQAAIACLHGESPRYEATDWNQISYLYRVLERHRPGPVVRVNRAMAEAEVFGADHGLRLLDQLEPAPPWHLYWAARAELLARRGSPADAIEAADALRRALDLGPNESDRRHFERRLAELDPSSSARTGRV